jgi:hypothetical protein
LVAEHHRRADAHLILGRVNRGLRRQQGVIEVTPTVQFP